MAWLAWHDTDIYLFSLCSFPSQDLRRIKQQAHQALASLEGLGRKVAVGRVIRAADHLPRRVTFLYDRAMAAKQAQAGPGAPPQANLDGFKPPEWNASLPVFLPIE